jgi:hypothetical protein
MRGEEMKLFDRALADLRLKRRSVARAACLLVVAVIFSGISVLPTFSQDGPRERLVHLYETQDWFKLRDALSALGPSPPLSELELSFFRASVEDAFNQPEAESALQKIIANRSAPHARSYAQLELYALFVRLGRYRDALATLKSLLSETPAGGLHDGLSMRLVRDEFLARFDNQSMVPTNGRRPTPVDFKFDKHGVVLLPVNVNGVPSKFLLDTGYTFCGISASEAKRLGLEISDRPSSMNVPGGQATTHTAIARKLSVGGVTLHSVAFDIIPDLLPPYDDPEVGGLLGVPAILALKRFKLDFKKSSFAVTPLTDRPQIAKNSNLALAGDEVLTNVGFRGGSLAFFVDLGSNQSNLNYSFGEMFPDLLASGNRKELPDTSAAGSRIIDVTFLSSPLHLIIGGRNVTIYRPYVTPKRSGMPRSIIAGGRMIALAHLECWNCRRLTLLSSIFTL